MSDCKVLREYCEQLKRNRFEEKVEMDDFLEKYKLIKLTQEDTEKSNKPIFTEEVENEISIYTFDKASGPEVSVGEFY